MFSKVKGTPFFGHRESGRSRRVFGGNGVGLLVYDILIDRQVKQMSQGPDKNRLKRMLAAFKHDPQEDDPVIGAKIEAARRKAERNLAEYPKVMGYCHPPVG